MKLCASNPIMGEYTLCGFAFDAPQTENDVADFEFAVKGQTITCESCRFVIEQIYKSYTINGKVK